MFKKLFLSDLIVNSSPTKRTVYIALLAAFSVVTNMFLEFKFFDVQFSLTIIVSVMIGGLIGAIPGFLACMLGDFIGYVYNSWGYLYMPWVGISTGMMAFIAGIVFNGVEIKSKGAVYIKLAIVCALSFLVCTVGINSTGFYFYNRAMGFSKAVLDYVAAHFGGNVSYVAYVAYRLIFKLQIVNCIVNYAVLFAVYPLILKIKIFRPSVS
ncbi:MAG: ECF transporter S component [Clostridia bacterium]|nr:ECF transporter S component [Clostridia bacterium]